MASSATTSVFDSPLVNGLGGLSHGSFFRIADSVDTTQPPGVVVVASNKDRDDIFSDARPSYWKILTFRSFLYSPNLTWLLMAAVVWQIYPYPLPTTTTAGVQQSESFLWQTFLWERLVFNMLLAFGYIGFWHVTLYGLHWCHRPFVPDRKYNLQKVLHNMLYTTWGVFHWTATEVAFVHCYQTGKLPLKHTSSTSALFSEVLILLAAAMWIPSFRDIHFYLAHRMIHVRWLYKYVHSVHHRNIDVEPFSGLAMHPVEHLYYFTCYVPFLVLPPFRYTPFLLYWMGFHTALSPAAAHSGWQDHFSADLLHYLHHRYCDCNYAAGINFDVYFGTYQASIKGAGGGSDTSSYNKATKKSDDAPSTRQSLDSKATLEGWWKLEHPEYQFGVLALIATSVLASSASWLSALPTAILLTVGPAIWALVLAVLTRPVSLSWRKTLLAPFDKDPWWGVLMHFGLGTLLGVLPSTYLLYLVLQR